MCTRYWTGRPRYSEIVSCGADGFRDGWTGGDFMGTGTTGFVPVAGVVGAEGTGIGVAAAEPTGAGVTEATAGADTAAAGTRKRFTIANAAATTPASAITPIAIFVNNARRDAARPRESSASNASRISAAVWNRPSGVRAIAVMMIASSARGASSRNLGWRSVRSAVTGAS